MKFFRMQFNELILAWMLSVMALQVACRGHSDEGESESHNNRRKTISLHEPAVDPEPQQQQPELHGSYTKMDVLMRGAVPQREDEYICTAYKLPDGEHYVTGYEPVAQGRIVHHLLLYGCEAPLQEDGVWACNSLCSRGSSKIMFAWARNAPEVKLPADVGYKVGGSTGINYVVLQLHYRQPLFDSEGDRSGLRLTVTSERQRYMQGILLMLSGGESLRPRVPKINIPISCSYEGKTELFPIGFRTHAHNQARVISGYMYNTSYNLIGKGNPQWPQAFYSAEKGVSIKPNDHLVGVCSYNTTQRSDFVLFGSTHNDEMCNFYIMFYTVADKGEPYFSCYGNQFPELYNNMPASADIPPPSNPELEAAGDIHVHSTSGAAAPVIIADVSWPGNATQSILGQVSGVATDSKDYVYVFHRGPRVWDGLSFDYMNKFTYVADGPIATDTILVLDSTGNIINELGANMFYMPHGLTVSPNDDIWVTDVALHQVMRIPHGSKVPDLVLGEKLVPGSDDSHFCKPSDVAVLSTGEFFVADGYCNSRIMKFSADGKLLLKFGEASTGLEGDGYPPLGALSIPHSLVAVPGKNLVCVADRENGRVQCFDYNGKPVNQIYSPAIGPRLFAITHSQHSGQLYAVNGPATFPQTKLITVQGFIMDPNRAQVVSTWAPPDGFSNPHDITVSGDGHALYVTEIEPNRVWKFKLTDGDAGNQSHKGDHKINTDQSDHHHSSSDLPIVFMATALSHSGEIIGSEGRDLTVTLIVACVVAIPLVVVLAVVMVLRARRCMAMRGRGHLDVGRLFLGGKPRGFESVRTTDDREDLDHVAESDSETEEFSNASLLRKA